MVTQKEQKPMKDPYEILGVPRDASPQQIRKVYRKLSTIYHPDTTVLERGYAQEKFKEINEAYQILSDPARRETYHRLRGYASPPQSHDEQLAPLYNDAMTHFKAERWPQAIDIFEAIWHVDAGYRDVAHNLQEAKNQIRLVDLYARGKLFLKQKQWAEAIDIFERIRVINPNFRGVAAQLASTRKLLDTQKLERLQREATEHLHAGQWQPAIAKLEEIRAIDPDFENVAITLAEARKQERWAALYTEADTFLRQEKWAEAVVRLKNIQSENPGYRDAAAKLNAAEKQELLAGLSDKAEDLIQQKRWGDAEATLTRIRQIRGRDGSGDVENYVEQGQLLYAANQPDKALIEFEAALSINPDYARAHAGLGWIYVAQHNLEDAARECNHALQLDRTCAWAHFGLGLIFAAQKQTAEAIRKFQVAEVLDVTWAWPHNSLGQIFAEQGKWNDAVRHYFAAIKLAPRWAAPRNGLGRVFDEQNSPDKAIREYKIAIKLDSTFAEPHNNLGKIYARRSKLSDAIREFQTAIQLNLQDAEAHFHLGTIFTRQNKLEQAVKEYRAAIALDPQDAMPHYGLGVVCAGQRKLDEAIREYQTAIEFDPQLTWPRIQLSIAYEKQRTKAKAVEAYETLLRLNDKQAPKRSRRWAVWRLGMTKLMPWGYWLLSTAIWLPLILALSWGGGGSPSNVWLISGGLGLGWFLTGLFSQRDLPFAKHLIGPLWVSVALLAAGAGISIGFATGQELLSNSVSAVMSVAAILLMAGVAFGAMQHSRDDYDKTVYLVAIGVAFGLIGSLPAVITYQLISSQTAGLIGSMKAGIAAGVINIIVLILAGLAGVLIPGGLVVGFLNFFSGIVARSYRQA